MAASRAACFPGSRMPPALPLRRGGDHPPPVLACASALLISQPRVPQFGKLLRLQLSGRVAWIKARGVPPTLEAFVELNWLWEKTADEVLEELELAAQVPPDLLESRTNEETTIAE